MKPMIVKLVMHEQQWQQVFAVNSQGLYYLSEGELKVDSHDG